MMHFNGSGVEVPTTGEPAPQASFDAAVKTSGVFIARIKRAGKRSKQLGWIELILLETEQLAMCSDSSLDSDSDTSERFLLFPLFDGSAFRQIKRHGHALTLMAPSYSIVLEAEAGDDQAATQASKWGRILQRLSSPEPSRSNAYFKGLGISLNTLASKPQRSKQGPKQLVPLQYGSSALQDNSHSSAGTNGETRYSQKDSGADLEPAPTHSAVDSRLIVSKPIDSQLASAQYARYHSAGVPRSASDKSMKSAKRLSLGLAKPNALSLDLGFGEDLKGILGALEPNSVDTSTNRSKQFPEQQPEDEVSSRKPAETVSKAEEHVPAVSATTTSSSTDQPAPAQLAHHEASSEQEALTAPQKPFVDVSSSHTPSPNSLYLQNASPSNSSLLSSSSNKSLNRMESILVKEQQQQLDRYGDRAAAMSTFDLSMPSKPVSASSSLSHLAADSAPSASNPPPGIPPPVPDSHPIRVAKRVSIARTSPSVQYIPRDDSGADSESESESDKKSNGGLPSPEPERRQPSQTAAMRKKNPGIVKAVKKFWSKRRVPKEQNREFKGPMELMREQEEAQRNMYEIPEPGTPPQETKKTNDEPPVQDASHETVRPSRSTAAGEWRALAMVQEESESEATPKIPQHTEEESLKVAQAVAPPTPSHATSAVPKLNSQSSISALSFRSMRSQGSISSGITSDDSMKALVQEQRAKPEQSKPEVSKSVMAKPQVAKIEAVKPETANVVARLDPKQDASWPRLVEAHLKAPSGSGTSHTEAKPAEKPLPSTSAKRAPPAAAPMSLDPGRFTVPDRTTNPIIRKVFESGNNKSTPALTKADGQHSASSSYSSFGSFKRSTPSYGSQASSLSSMSYSNSASSISAPNLATSQKSANALEVTLLTVNLWVSKWGGTKWTPLSQLELRTDIVATSGGIRVLVMNPGGVGCIPLRFSPQCELRRVSAHDTELKTPDSTYMFRGRDPENSQKFYRTLATLQSDGVGSAAVSLPSISSTDSSDDIMDSRRRTLVPPVLSRNSYAPKYMGMSTSTIVEE